MEIRLKEGTQNYVGGVSVEAVNFWEREGRMTAKVVLEGEDLIVGVKDDFTVGEPTCQVLNLEKGLKNRYVLVLESKVGKKDKEPKVVRLEESQFGQEEKVTCLFKSVPCM
jgi:hypothetical protein